MPSSGHRPSGFGRAPCKGPPWGPGRVGLTARDPHGRPCHLDRRCRGGGTPSISVLGPPGQQPCAEESGSRSKTKRAARLRVTSRWPGARAFRGCP